MDLTHQEWRDTQQRRLPLDEWITRHVNQADYKPARLKSFQDGKGVKRRTQSMSYVSLKKHDCGNQWYVQVKTRHPGNLQPLPISLGPAELRRHRPTPLPVPESSTSSTTNTFVSQTNVNAAYQFSKTDHRGTWGWRQCSENGNGGVKLLDELPEGLMLEAQGGTKAITVIFYCILQQIASEQLR